MISPLIDAVVILASSRSQGNTRLLVDYLIETTDIPIIDLSSKNISYYDYERTAGNDDFIPVIQTLAEKQVWILATPVYWYSMSAQMKTFFDRLTDLLTTHKDLGWRLRGRAVALLASGTDPNLPEGFEAPFRLTCRYLGLNFLGTCYGQFEGELAPVVSTRDVVAAFGEKLLRNTGDSY
jgi:multimeric flavodoxin WrbA